jgi:hypothetical protein
LCSSERRLLQDDIGNQAERPLGLEAALVVCAQENQSADSAVGPLMIAADTVGATTSATRISEGVRLDGAD